MTREKVTRRDESISRLLREGKQIHKGKLKLLRKGVLMRWKDFKWILVGIFFLISLAFMIFFGAQELGRDRKEKEIVLPETKESEEIARETPEMLTENIAQTKEEESVAGPEKLFTIQVAAFRDKLGAEVLVEQLEKKKYKTMLSLKDLGEEGVWYRVWVGDFDSKEKAAEFLPELKKEYKNSFIKAK